MHSEYDAIVNFLTLGMYFKREKKMSLTPPKRPKFRPLAHCIRGVV